ncbi:MAG TPA: hypothetical protein VK171_04305, partial [Fimbriimonas sp.]|nr:hypothetical protein [Fimbriimonas sp.]
LGRTDLVQVKPEDLRNDTVGTPNDYPDFDDEEEVGELDDDSIAPGFSSDDHSSRGFLANRDQGALPFDSNAEAVGSPTDTLIRNQAGLAPQHEERIVSGNGAHGVALVEVGSVTGSRNRDVYLAGSRSGGSVASSSAASAASKLDEVGEKIRMARLQGYEGDPCTNCGAFTLVRNGVCLKCQSCGETSGCS